MDILAKIAEEKIAEAIKRGEFDNLPGAGKPLKLDDDSHIPPELRVSYRILKNAGFLPPEIEMRKEIRTLRELLGRLEEGEEKSRKLRELNYKIMKLNTMEKRLLNLEELPEYSERIINKLSR